ncbi:MAG: SMP-30/gluconolactonase/LRE family protein [Synechococcus sp.]
MFGYTISTSAPMLFSGLMAIASTAIANPTTTELTPKQLAESVSPEILTPEIVAQIPNISPIETVFEFGPETPPGNIAIAPDGRIFMSLHGFYGQPLKLVEVESDGSDTPYPPEDWANAPVGDGPGLSNVLGIRADRQGILWMLDSGGEGQSGRLVGWNTQTETLHQVIYLAAPVVGDGAFLNDLAIDREHETIYITDTATPETSALIVVDLVTGRARRVLAGSEFTRPEDLDMVIDGETVLLNGEAARIGANPIAVDPTNTWLYFAPMSGLSMYRVRTADLRNESLAPEELAERVERYGDKPISDGSTVDGEGNVYITSITDDSIGVVRPDGSYETLYQADEMSWPDGFAFGPDGKIYVTVNELHRSPVLSDGENLSQGEFKIVRFEPLAPGASGR